MISISKQSIIELPINHLKFYDSTKGTYFFNQIFLNLAITLPDPPAPTEEMALIVFPKNITTVGKTADSCTASTLNVTINSALIFSETTTNCTINVYIAKSKVLQGFNIEWVWT